MLRLTIRTAWAHWRRFVLTTTAVVVGVSFVVGSFVLTDSLAASINHLLRDADAQVDFVIGAGHGGGVGLGLGRGGGRNNRSPLPATLTADVAKLPGVAAVDPVVTGPAALLDKAGKANDYDLGVLANWPSHPSMSAVRLTSGRAPSRDGDIVVDTQTAADRNLHIGSTVRIATQRGVSRERVCGLAERGTGDLGLAGQILDVTLARATALVGTQGQINSLLVRADAGANHDTLQAALSSTVGPDRSVRSAQALLADARARIQDRLKSFNGLMLGFAAVTLFVSGFLIWNTFSTVVAQRTSELALLRAVGASRGQVFGAVVGEGALVGAVSSGIGIGIGVLVAIGLRAALGAFGFDLPSAGTVLAPRSILVGLVVGIGITVLSALGPARRATTVAPVAAIRRAATEPARLSRRRPAIGLALVVAGLALGARGLADHQLAQTPRLEWLGAGGAVAFLGLAMLARSLTAPVIGVLGWPLGRIGGVGARLARRNAVRDPRRTASTALALAIGMTLVALTLVLGESVKTAYGGALAASIDAPVVVSADGISPIDTTTQRSIRSTPGVDRVVALSNIRERLDGLGYGRMDLTVGNIGSIAGVVRPDFRSGGYPATDSQIAVSASFADEQHLHVGDSFTLEPDDATGQNFADPPSDPRVPVTISGIYIRDELLGDGVLRPATAATVDPTNPPTTKLLLVTTTGDARTVAQRLAAVTAGIPNSTAQTTAEYVASQTGTLDIVLGIVDVLLLFAVLVAGLGISNTLALAVVERTRELGLLRAAGSDRRTIRRMVRLEGVLIACYGGLMGVGFGIAFGAAVSAALPVDTARLTLPGLRLVLLFVGAGVLGLIAAAVPARRAARLDVLEAIAEA